MLSALCISLTPYGKAARGVSEEKLTQGGFMCVVAIVVANITSKMIQREDERLVEEWDEWLLAMSMLIITGTS